MSDAPDLARLVDLVLAFTLVELAALWLYRSATGRGLPLSDFLANMLSGVCLMLALRCLAGSSPVSWVVFWLLAAGLVHGGDIVLRLQREARARTGASTGAAT